MAKNRYNVGSPYKEFVAKGRNRTGRAGSGKSWTRTFILTLWLVLAFTLAGGSLYLWSLDRAVVRKFQTKQYSVPSSVYSAPTILKAGLGLDRPALIKLLGDLDYAPTPGAEPRVGEYKTVKANLALATHELHFAGGGHEVGRTALVEFSKSGITALRDRRTGKLLPSLTLDPMLLGRFYGEEHATREPATFKDIEKRFAPALLAAEDNRFYSHHGVDLQGIARAAFVNVLKGKIRQGGSTITQQLVKNLWLTPDRTFRRKINEVAMALMLERHFGKREILETYANVIYFGQRGSVSILGVAQASRYYFGKPPSALTWGEAAMLAGLIRSPAQYSPFHSPSRARSRRDQVLDKLFALKQFDATALKRAKAEPVQTIPPPAESRRAAYFVDRVAASLAEDHGGDELESAGLQVSTTLSAPLQTAAENAVADGLRYLESQHKRLAKIGLQAALVSIDPHTGHVLAYVGGRDYGESQFDRAGQAKRQIGSLVKPFIYYAAVDKGYASTTSWSNDAVTISTARGPWQPANYEKGSGGRITMRESLEKSLNLPTVRIAQEVGLGAVKKTLEAAGLEGPIQAYPALALGAVEATPAEMARAYATLAAMGTRPVIQSVKVVGTQKGDVLRRDALESELVYSPAAAFVVDQMLKGVVQRGTAVEAQRIGYKGDLAGKTGTTSDYHDAWFVGFTPNMVTVVWVGSDGNADLQLPGSKLALPIWGEYMMTAARWQPAATFTQPDGIVWAGIDPASGELTVEGCPEKRSEAFVAGSEPKKSCSLHQGTIQKILDWFR